MTHEAKAYVRVTAHSTSAPRKYNPGVRRARRARPGQRWRPTRHLIALGGTLLAAGAGAETTAPAAPASAYETPPLEEVVVVVGTRGKPRAVLESPVPVDVFSSEDLATVNSSDLLEVLKTIVPSFYVDRTPVADGATFIRPTKLRGLDSHHTLVLLDGKRRHRGAVLRLGSFGPHGVDIGGLPAIAIESVEVLRDGAAAQYGSDAIAGVFNFRLRTAAQGWELRARYGGYDQGDGTEATLEANAGLPLGDAGFLNVSAQLADAAATSRSEPYDLPIAGSGQTPLEATRNRTVVDGVTYYGPDAFSYSYGPDGTLLQVLPGSDGVPDDLDTRYADNYHAIGGARPFASPEQIWGAPARRQAMFVANAALPLGETATAYGFATYSRKAQSSGFFYRRPGVSQLRPLRLADGRVYDPRANLYPAGFTPQFHGVVHDRAIHAGARGKRDSGLGYDVSATYGVSAIRYRIDNTLNPSLGPDTPTSFRPGSLINDELAVNADFTLSLEDAVKHPLRLAFGLEYRNEGYQVEEGEPLSYAVGPFARPDPFNLEITQAEVDADPDDALTVIECRVPGFAAVGALCPVGDPVNNTVPIGANGFPGYPPAFASNVNRRSQAAYLDAELNVTSQWLTNAALRVEHFEDFGSVAIGKLATRYQLSENVNLRAAFGTGFRAPTPGQISTTNVSTRIAADGTPVAEGLFPAAHPASGLFGATPLDAETSRSISAGATASWGGGSLTADYYRIDLKDRITLSSRFPVGADERDHLLALGVPGAGDIAQVRFFVNDVRTRTQGVDIVANQSLEAVLAGTSVEAAFNFNDTEVLDRGRFLFAESEYDIEHGLPAARGVITARHARDRLRLTLRVRWFGKYSNAKTGLLKDIQRFDPEAFVDMEAEWTFGRGHSVKLGLENAFDNYPDEAEYESCCGMVYRRDSVAPWQGALYYLQLRARYQ